MFSFREKLCSRRVFYRAARFLIFYSGLISGLKGWCIADLCLSFAVQDLKKITIQRISKQIEKRVQLPVKYNSSLHLCSKFYKVYYIF